MRKEWTAEEVEFVSNKYSTMTDKELAQALGRNESGVQSKRLELGLQKPKIRRKYSFNDVIEAFAETDYELLSTSSEYVNCGTNNLRYICPRHRDIGEQVTSLAHLKEGKGCRLCGIVKCGLTRQIELDKDGDRAMCESHDFTYIDTYRRNGTIVIKYICNKHKELGEQETPRDNFVRRPPKGCQYCNGHNLPKWYIEKKMKEVNPNIIPLEEYDRLTDRIMCKCLKHNIVHRKSIQEILMGKGCKVCGIEKQSQTATKTIDQAQNDVDKYNPHISLLNYKGATSNCDCYCNVHHKKFTLCYSSLLRRSSGCDECYVENVRERMGMGIDEFKRRLSIIHPELEVRGDYINNSTKITIYCKKHQCEYEVAPANLLTKLSCCPKSRKTYKEEIVCSLLEKWGYTVKRQKTFEDCIDKTVLPFDAYLPDYNTVIEYQGEQHYYMVRFGDCSDEEMKWRFEYYKKHDNIKKEYCRSHHIQLIYVPYWEFEDLEYYLFSQLSKYGIIDEILDGVG